MILILESHSFGIYKTELKIERQKVILNIDGQKLDLVNNIRR